MNMKASIAVLSIMLPLSQACASTFFDGTFSNSDWTAAKISDTTAGQSATFSASQTSSGGNPDSFRETIHDYGVGGIILGHLDNNFIYNPATSGAIASIDFSYDLRAFVTGNSGAIAYSLVALQNNSYYLVNSFDLVSTNQWSPFRHSGLTSADFLLLHGASHPDFTATGSAIKFGYFTSNGTSFGTGHTDSGIDNYSVNITAAIPEPSTAFLFGLGLIGFTVGPLSRMLRNQPGTRRYWPRPVKQSEVGL